jgi:hypothetical protein
MLDTDWTNVKGSLICNDATRLRSCPAALHSREAAQLPYTVAKLPSCPKLRPVMCNQR